MAAMNANSDLASDSSEFDSGDDDSYGWISYFLSLKGNELFCAVDEDYLHDNFNLTGLANQVTYYEYALDLITDMETEEPMTSEHRELVENDADVLYGLIHARYILTNRGLHAMLDKYRHQEFGTCPRLLCEDQPMLPVGMTDQRNKEAVKLYCPRCEDVYKPKSSRYDDVDGVFFGTTFPHLFFLVFPELKPQKSKEFYIPRIFGFRIHKTAYLKSFEARRKQQDHKKAGTPAARPT